MEQKLLIYNTLSRSKELFKPLHAPHVGMYIWDTNDQLLPSTFFSDI